MGEREDWITLIRTEYDQKPDLGWANYPAFNTEWDDGAGRIADAILADKVLLLQKYAAARHALASAKKSVLAAALGSCDCNAKSNNPAYHGAHCQWLKLVSALESLDIVEEVFDTGEKKDAENG